MKPPHIIIHVGDGCLQGVTSDQPITYTLADYDLLDEENGIKIPQPGRPDEWARVIYGEAEADVELHARIMEAIRNHKPEGGE